jgi:hypothetical protein
MSRKNELKAELLEAVGMFVGYYAMEDPLLQEAVLDSSGLRIRDIDNRWYRVVLESSSPPKGMEDNA